VAYLGSLVWGKSLGLHLNLRPKGLEKNVGPFLISGYGCTLQKSHLKILPLFCIYLMSKKINIPLKIALRINIPLLEYRKRLDISPLIFLPPPPGF